MIESRIIYGELNQPLHPNGEYLLMEAGIQDGTYSREDFLNRINDVSLDKVQTEEGKNDLMKHKKFFKILSKISKTVTIKDFNPDRKSLEKFVNTTFEDLHKMASGLK